MMNLKTKIHGTKKEHDLLYFKNDLTATQAAEIFDMKRSICQPPQR